MLQRLVLQLNLAKQAEQKTLMMRFLDGEIIATNYDSAGLVICHADDVR